MAYLAIRNLRVATFTVYERQRHHYFFLLTTVFVILESNNLRTKNANKDKENKNNKIIQTNVKRIGLAMRTK